MLDIITYGFMGFIRDNVVKPVTDTAINTASTIENVINTVDTQITTQLLPDYWSNDLSVQENSEEFVVIGEINSTPQ